MSTDPAHQAPPVSRLMRSLLDPARVGEDVSLAELLDIFGARSFGLLMLLLGFLNLAVLFLPGFSLLVGVPLIVISAQMALGFAKPVLPSFLTRLDVKRDHLERAMAKGADSVEYLEGYIRPRFSSLSAPRLDQLNALVCLLLSCLIAIPFPVLNIPPTIGLILMALGLLGRDGIFILVGYFVGASCVMMYMMFGAMVAILAEMWIFFVR